MSIIGISVVNIGDRKKYAGVILAVVILTYFTENFLRSPQWRITLSGSSLSTASGSQ